MGPRPVRRGNFYSENGDHIYEIELQWGHALSGVETFILSDQGNPIQDLLQWGHALSGVETTASSLGYTSSAEGFNGATPFQAWKRCGRRRKYQLEHGFNGATPFQAWKPVTSSCN